MSILSDRDIKESLKNGGIIITPFNEKNLGSASYDVTLGENYYSWNKIDGILLYNPYSHEDVQKLWKLNKAINVTDEYVKEYGCKPNSKIIIIKPRETILAHTNEFIGGINNITSAMQCRSSLARNGVTVCKCAWAGNPGYINKWTMEIENCGPYSVILTVGERIAQIAFMRTGEVEKNYSGSYQSSNDIETLQKEWKPEMMLPRLKYD